MVTLVANNCETLHPDLGQLIPDMNQTYPLQQVSLNYDNLKVMDCSRMYENLTVMNLCYQKYGAEIDP